MRADPELWCQHALPGQNHRVQGHFRDRPGGDWASWAGLGLEVALLGVILGLGGSGFEPAVLVGSLRLWAMSPSCRGSSCAVAETKGGAFVFGDRVQKRVSDRLQIFLGEAESVASTCGQASMRESGPHQTPVAMSVQSQKHVAELVSEDPSQRSRVDSVVDIGELLAVPVPIDGARHLLPPEGNAACARSWVWPSR